MTPELCEQAGLADFSLHSPVHEEGKVLIAYQASVELCTWDNSPVKFFENDSIGSIPYSYPISKTLQVSPSLAAS